MAEQTGVPFSRAHIPLVDMIRRPPSPSRPPLLVSVFASPALVLLPITRPDQLPVFSFFTHTRTFPPPKRSFLPFLRHFTQKTPTPQTRYSIWPSIHQTQASFLFGELHLQLFNCLSTKPLLVVRIPNYSSQTEYQSALNPICLRRYG